MPIQSNPYLPFSQRAGLDPVPPQLKLGEASPELRRLIDYYLSLEMQGETHYGTASGYFAVPWQRVAQDLHVLFFGQNPHKFQNNPYDWKSRCSDFVSKATIGPLFNFVEFLLRHANCSTTLKEELASAFETSRAAYRIIDLELVVAIGTEQQADAFQIALLSAEQNGAQAARTHLVKAGVALKDAQWADSVRESIHAVEAMAIRIAPGTKDLAGAIRTLELKGHLHGSLKRAFDLLYAYSSNQEGIRHANILSDKAQVDEADAMFMLGACASFVTYLLSRST